MAAARWPQQVSAAARRRALGRAAGRRRAASEGRRLDRRFLVGRGAAFQAFARETVLARDGFAERLGLRPAMERYFAGRGGYPFPRQLSILGHLGWRLLLLELWSRHYLRARAA